MCQLAAYDGIQQNDRPACTVFALFSLISGKVSQVEINLDVGDLNWGCILGNKEHVETDAAIHVCLASWQWCIWPLLVRSKQQRPSRWRRYSPYTALASIFPLSTTAKYLCCAHCLLKFLSSSYLVLKNTCLSSATRLGVNKQIVNNSC